MALSKNPFLRYRIINSCFTNKRRPYWSIEEIIEKLADHDLIVEKRTVELDFQSMRHDERVGYHAPISYCRKEKKFHYSDPDFSIDALPITHEEINALKFATAILKQYKGVRLVKQFEGAVDKVAKVVDQLNGNQTTTDLMHFEHAPYYKGIEHLDALVQAIAGKQALDITYHKFLHDKPTKYTVHPYFLKEYDRRWYLLCLSEEKQNIITLALDRIEGINETLITYRENKNLKPEEYFQNTIGITTGKGAVENIQLLFTPFQGNYIKTQHLHHTQEILSDDENGLLISLQLVPNYELIQLILRFGSEVKVMKPLSLRKKVCDVLRKASANYN